MTDVYQRTVTEEEAQQEILFILKEALGLFPAVGRVFELRQGGTVRETAVEARECHCRGPEDPHHHYFLRWRSLRSGETVVIQPDRTKAHQYTLRIRSTQGQHEFCG